MALMLSATTTMASVLLFSPMPIIQDFGLITAITVLFSLVLALMVLPVLVSASARGQNRWLTMLRIRPLERLDDVVHDQPLFPCDQGVGRQGVMSWNALVLQSARRCNSSSSAALPSDELAVRWVNRARGSPVEAGRVGP